MTFAGLLHGGKSSHPGPLEPEVRSSPPHLDHLDGKMNPARKDASEGKGEYGNGFS